VTGFTLRSLYPPGEVPGDVSVGCVEPRASLDAVSKRKNARPCSESNSGRPSRNVVTLLTELPLFLVVGVLNDDSMSVLYSRTCGTV
jgi:hypothetical protein